MLDFMLKRAVFVIGLHCHHLIAVFRNLGLDGADLAFELFAGALIALGLFLCGLQRCLGRA